MQGAAFMEAGGYRRMLAMESKLPPTEEEVREGRVVGAVGPEGWAQAGDD
jgi:hypothetical protein